MADQPASGSTLLLDEHFAAGNDAFMVELLLIKDGRKLAGFVDKWKSDPRPWARLKIFDYLAKPLASPGHNVVVKRLFKEAEKQKDSQLMAAFLHAFDCLVRRQRRMKWHWDRTTRQSWREEELFAAKDNLLPPQPPRMAQNPKTMEKMRVPSKMRIPKNPRLFSYRTRYYLRRRVWRYFRFLGYRTPDQYPAAIAPALAYYTDADLAKGEYILDSWCLLNICYRTHSALTFTPSHVKLIEGHTLNELVPTPKHAKIWASPAAAEPLWNLLTTAQSRLIRVWAIDLLKQHHQAFLTTLTPARLLALFTSFDADIQQFASELLEKLPSLATLPITTWLQLLETQDASALAAICSLMVRNVTAERLTLEQTVSLTNSVAAPVANLGLIFLRTRSITSATDRETLSNLYNARCLAVAPIITQFALSILGTKSAYDVALVSRFFDAMVAPTRTAAWAWLTPDSPGFTDPALWSRLLETPYEDVRLQLVSTLTARQSLPGATTDTLTPIWTAVLVGINRGGRHKIKALHQISRALTENPDHAAKLFPVMAVAIRSVRAPEARIGLASVVQVITRNPALTEAAALHIPELHLVSEGATA